jgi:hypothetical protein
LRRKIGDKRMQLGSLLLPQIGRAVVVVMLSIEFGEAALAGMAGLLKRTGAIGWWAIVLKGRERAV